MNNKISIGIMYLFAMVLFTSFVIAGFESSDEIVERVNGWEGAFEDFTDDTYEKLEERANQEVFDNNLDNTYDLVIDSTSYDSLEKEGTQEQFDNKLDTLYDKSIEDESNVGTTIEDWKDLLDIGFDPFFFGPFVDLPLLIGAGIFVFFFFKRKRMMFWWGSRKKLTDKGYKEMGKHADKNRMAVEKEGSTVINSLKNLEDKLEDSLKDTLLEEELAKFEGVLRAVAGFGEHEDIEFWVIHYLKHGDIKALPRNDRAEVLIPRIMKEFDARLARLEILKEHNKSLSSLSQADRDALHTLVSEKIRDAKGENYTPVQSVREIEGWIGEWIIQTQNQFNQMTKMKDEFGDVAKINHKTDFKVMLKDLHHVHESIQRHMVDLKDYRKSELQFVKVIKDLLEPPPVQHGARVPVGAAAP